MSNEQDDSAKKKQGRGPAKPYPTMPFEKVIVLPNAIAEHGFGEKMRRVTLFEQLGRSPGSGYSRNLIISSNRYGLTIGSYTAEYLEITEIGEEISKGNFKTDKVTRELAFQAAIGKFESFRSLYERILDSQRIPPVPVIRDELGELGIAEDDCEAAAGIFLENIRFLGMVQESQGIERITPIEEETNQIAVSKNGDSEQAAAIAEPDLPSEQQVPMNAKTGSPDLSLPALHIDIQVHIDSSASPKQIDQVFSSMARHLYGRDTQ